MAMREVGLAIGARFAEQIHQLLDHYDFFQQEMLPYHRTPEGQRTYQALLDLHRACYPDYIVELEGIAEGAGRPFEELFLVNVRGEYAGYIHDSRLRGCFDLVAVTEDVALVGHNEDGTPAALNNMYVVHAQIEGMPAFTALSYPGFLCGNAFGFNSEGILFSIDNVRPRNVHVGVGRHFMARSLFETHSLEDAIAQVTVPGRAAGFSYTIGSLSERRVVNVEVAPDKHHVREIRGYYAHTNHYLNLTDVEQVIGASSRARLERANELLRAGWRPSQRAVLAILGDQADKQYPIYRTATPPDKGMTLCTALFDLDRRSLRIYTGHPVLAAEQFLEFAL
ncbi:MAG TPA: hypothetical protein EYP04_04495 [Anaerolineae bacterium]|nr:hypothetical protein [Anaerolineae bacterium]